MACCKRYESLIWEAVETGERSSDLEEHIAWCRECRHALDVLGSALPGFEVLRNVSAPDPRAAVRARLAEPQRRHWPVPAMVGALVAACLVALMFTAPLRPPKPAPHVAPAAMATHGIVVRRQNTAPNTEQKVAVGSQRMNQVALSTRPSRSISKRHHIHRHALRDPERMAIVRGASDAKSQASSLDKPCHQITTLDIRVDRQPEPPAQAANPTYRCASVPKVLIVPMPDPRMSL